MTSLEIEAFLTVQQTGSVTKAAERLYIRQGSRPTHLRSVQQVERDNVRNDQQEKA